MEADFKKVYDSVKWDLLGYMMQKLDFYNKWIKWMIKYVD